MRVATPYPSEVTFAPSGMHLRWPRFSAERTYIGRFVPWREVAQVDPASAPPTVRLTDGRTLFIAATERDRLRMAVATNYVATGRRGDVWSALLAPFLDTDDEIVGDHIDADLRGWGLSADETKRIRRRVRVPMMAMTLVTWEWLRYGHVDVVVACGIVRVPPLVGSGRAYRRFRRWTDEIADRGYRADAG